MAPSGLRELKKQQTRELIAQAAASLFAEFGYERVAIVDVAKRAGVSEQTVYNYFSSKERLVLDREQQLTERVLRRLRGLPQGAGPTAAVRPEALALVDAAVGLPRSELRGGLGYLAALSPTVRRLSLEMTDRLADAITSVLVERDPGLPAHRAKLHAIALAWVFHTVTEEVGRRHRGGQSRATIARELRSVVEDMLDALEQWPLPATEARR